MEETKQLFWQSFGSASNGKLVQGQSYMHECCLGVSRRNGNTYYSNIDRKRISLVIVGQASGQTVKSCFSYRILLGKLKY